MTAPRHPFFMKGICSLVHCTSVTSARQLTHRKLLNRHQHCWYTTAIHLNSLKRGFTHQKHVPVRGLSTVKDKVTETEKSSKPKDGGEHNVSTLDDTFRGSLLRDVHRVCVQELEAAGVPEPDESVNLIIAHFCGKKMIHEVNLDIEVTLKDAVDIQMMCKKRLERVPVQYIIGEWDFHDMTLHMEPGILVPRPETEELAAYIVEDLLARGRSGCYKVLDIGCGSGALSLYILKRLPHISCVALDKSQKACSLTLKNAKVHSLYKRLQVVHGDIFTGDCLKTLIEKGPFDVIVSNPPYIPAQEMDRLEQEVARYEDFDALCGGQDGLDIIRQILSVSKKLLNPTTGTLWLEVDLSHPDKIEQIINTDYQLCLNYLATIPDFTKRGRFCKIQIKA